MSPALDTNKLGTTERRLGTGGNDRELRGHPVLRDPAEPVAWELLAEDRPCVSPYAGDFRGCKRARPRGYEHVCTTMA